MIQRTSLMALAIGAMLLPAIPALAHDTTAHAPAGHASTQKSPRSWGFSLVQLP